MENIMSKIWHLTLTRATHAPKVTFKSSGNGEVTLHRGKVTVTSVDLGATLKSPMVRVIRVEEKHKVIAGAGTRVDAVVKAVEPAVRRQPVKAPELIPVVKVEASEPVVEPVKVEASEPVVEPVKAESKPKPRARKITRKKSRKKSE